MLSPHHSGCQIQPESPGPGTVTLSSEPAPASPHQPADFCSVRPGILAGSRLRESGWRALQSMPWGGGVGKGGGGALWCSGERPWCLACGRQDGMNE